MIYSSFTAVLVGDEIEREVTPCYSGVSMLMSATSDAWLHQLASCLIYWPAFRLKIAVDAFHHQGTGVACFGCTSTSGVLNHDRHELCRFLPV